MRVAGLVHKLDRAHRLAPCTTCTVCPRPPCTPHAAPTSSSSTDWMQGQSTAHPRCSVHPSPALGAAQGQSVGLIQISSRPSAQDQCSMCIPCNPDQPCMLHTVHIPDCPVCCMQGTQHVHPSVGNAVHARLAVNARCSPQGTGPAHAAYSTWGWPKTHEQRCGLDDRAPQARYGWWTISLISLLHYITVIFLWYPMFCFSIFWDVPKSWKGWAVWFLSCSGLLEIEKLGIIFLRDTDLVGISW